MTEVKIENEESSFFKGFSWRICTCPVCGVHHGCLFTPLDKHCDLIKALNKTICLKRRKFYGIVTTRLKDSTDVGEKIEL